MNLIKINNNLYRTQSQAMFGYQTVGYLLKTQKNNIFIDAPDNLSAYAEHIDYLGGINTHIFTHSHKTISYTTEAWLRQKYNINSLRYHDFTWVARTSKLSTVLFSDKIILYHVPGHTKDSIVITWNYDESDLKLFSGDTICVINDFLTIPYTFSENHTQLKHSLNLLRLLNPDWLYCSTGNGTLNTKITNKNTWLNNLKEI